MRRIDRQITDPDRIEHILAAAKILHLGLNDGERPYVVPLHYGYAMVNSMPVFYTHSASEGHKLDLIAGDGRVFVELECDVQLLSGGDAACRYGSAYASLMGPGTAEIVTEPAEKCLALRLLMENQTGRIFDITEKMADAVTVIRIRLDSYTAKGRETRTAP